MSTAGWFRLADGVFARRYEPWDVTVGVVAGPEGVLVIDSRATLGEGAELLADLQAIESRPPRWIVNTHDHFDHVGGNGVFPAADVLTAGGDVVDLGGGRLVELHHFGPAHTAGDVVVAVPDAGVIFAGDLVEESGPPAYGDDSFPLDWPVANARLLGHVGDGNRVVPGHGQVVDRQFVVDQLRGLELVAATIRSLWVAEVPVDVALAEGAGRWPFPAESLADGVRRGYWQMEVSAGRGTGG